MGPLANCGLDLMMMSSNLNYVDDDRIDDVTSSHHFKVNDITSGGLNIVIL